MATDKKPWRNRKERKEWARRLQSVDPGLEVVHPHAAGIDVGNGAHYVAVRPDRDPEPVRRFECFTADLHRLADWLETCGVQQWRCSLPGCTGFPSTRCSKNVASMSISSTRGTPRTCRDARAMYRRANGC
jgi:hypothetical protein